MEKVGNGKVSNTYAMTESQCSPEMPLSQTAQLVLWTRRKILRLQQDQVTVKVMSPVPLIHVSLGPRKSSKESSSRCRDSNCWKASWSCCLCVSKEKQDCKTTRDMPNPPNPEAAQLCRNSATPAVKKDPLKAARPLSAAQSMKEKVTHPMGSKRLSPVCSSLQPVGKNRIKTTKATWEECWKHER